MGPWAVTVTHKKQDVPHKDADIHVVLLSGSGVYTVKILWRREERYKGSMDWVLACIHASTGFMPCALALQPQSRQLLAEQDGSALTIS